MIESWFARSKTGYWRIIAELSEQDIPRREFIKQPKQSMSLYTSYNATRCLELLRVSVTRHGYYVIYHPKLMERLPLIFM